MNNRSFEDLESTLENILSPFYHTLYLWTMAYVHSLSFSFEREREREGGPSYMMS
jgi:hypothetical protein